MVLITALGGRALPTTTRVLEHQFAGSKRFRLPRGGRLFCQAEKLPDCKIMGEGAAARKSERQALIDLRKPLGEHLLKSNCMPIIIRLAWHDSGTYDKVESSQHSRALSSQACCSSLCAAQPYLNFSESSTTELYHTLDSQRLFVWCRTSGLTSGRSVVAPPEASASTPRSRTVPTLVSCCQVDTSQLTAVPPADSITAEPD